MSTCFDEVFCLDRARVETQFHPRDEMKAMHRSFFIQIVLVSLVQCTLQLLLKPLGQKTPMVSLTLAAVIIGPVGLGQFGGLGQAIFPDKSLQIVETVGKLACMIHLFLTSVKLDFDNGERLSRKTRVIGVSTFIVPLVLTLSMVVIVKDSAPSLIRASLPIIAVTQSSTSLQVVSVFLSDLKLLNTELGIIATSASSVSAVCSWILVSVTFSVKEAEYNLLRWFKYFSSACFLILFIIYGLRKIVIWIVKKTPRGEPIRRIDFLLILLMVFGTGLLGEMFGVHWYFGPVILGMVIPDGPPIGSALENKLNYLTSGLFLPIFFCDVGSKLNSDKDNIAAPWILLFSSLAFLGKLIGTVIPAVFYQMGFKDAIMLALILSTRGIFDLAVYSLANSMELISSACYARMVMNAMVVTGIISPIVYFLYDPSTKYIVNRIHAIESAKQNAELRILICVYNQENVPTIINILEASNPTNKSPIVVYLLHLIELMGRVSPLLIAHNRQKDMFEKPTASDNIINGFKVYEKIKNGVFTLQPFTAITPFTTAHDYICTVAIEKKTCLIIIPFHKQWNVEGTTEWSKCRNINKKLLTRPPCSIGILIDRGKLNHGTSVVSLWSKHNIGVIFLGGKDDREALSYAMRMAEHPNVHLTVHHLLPTNYNIINMNEKILDNHLIDDYKDMSGQYNHYKEEPIKDYVEIVRMIRSMENEYNLILVGRQQISYSRILSGLAEWNEYPELGFFGDMLASSDFKSNVSVLVVQQHYLIET